MSFALSKILWTLIEPINIAAGLMVVAALLLWVPRVWWIGRLILLFIAVGVAASASFRIGDWLIRPLEYRFPQPALPAEIDGIVVLGGFLNPPMSYAHHEAELTDDGTRLLTFLTLAQKFKQAKLVFAGGNSVRAGSWPTEATVMRQLLEDIGFDQTRVTFEDRSRNTYENALYTKELIHPAPNERWILITSAFNMPRAVGCFRAVGWPPVIPYPSDYKSGLATPFRTGAPLTDFLNEVTLALHEWLGLAAYHMLGRTDAWFPRPQ